VPDYFHNNIAWVKDGSISQQTFLDTYYTLSHQGLIHAPEPEPTPEPTPEPIPEPTPEPIEVFEPIPEVFAEPDTSITDNMVRLCGFVHRQPPNAHNRQASGEF